MTYPHTDPNRYGGLFTHTEQHLGEVLYAQGPVPQGRNRGFAIGFHAHPQFAMVSAATTGVRFQDVSAPLPQEYVVSAQPDQSDEAGYLVHVGASQVVQTGRGYIYGQGYLNAEPLIPGTNIEFLLAWPHPFLDKDFDTYRDDGGDPALQFITLIPATRAEFEHIRDHDSPIALLELWESRDTSLLDLHRASAI